MSKFNKGWYVIYTRPCQEKKVALQLQDKLSDVFLPTMKTLRIWCDRKKYVDTPVFPSYIFVYLSNQEEYYTSLKADGALYYVKTGRENARVSEEIILNIKSMITHGRELQVTTDRFSAGQPVTVQRGALAGLSGELVKVNGDNKILIRINLLQRNLLVTVPSENLLLEDVCRPQ
jgi:transcription antitermination factor NusG